MTIEQPIWLILIPFLVLLGWRVPALKLWRPLRVLVCLTMVALLLEPRWQGRGEGLDLWVLVDRSDSVSQAMEARLPEWLQILKDNRKDAEDRLQVVDFAAEVAVASQGGSEHRLYTGGGQLTRTRLALENVLARVDEQRSSKVLVLSDGYSTESLGDVSNRLVQSGIPVDYRLLSTPRIGDIQISALDVPEQVQVNEPFLLSVQVQGEAVESATVPLQLYQNGQLMKRTEVTLVKGQGKAQFSVRLPRTGSHQFSAKLLLPNDANEGNNYAEQWVQVQGGPRVLLVTAYENDPLAQVLAQQAYDVEVVQATEAQERLRVGQLLGAESVIFHNVPAHEIPIAFLDALPFYVEEQGGGFLMIGGERSFGAGGYFSSSVDALLPVSMELKNDHRKLSVAMAIVMDRSGSMTLGVNGPGGLVTKMELANNGAAQAIELLSYQDQIALLAVDTRPTPVIPLQTVGNNKAFLQERAMRVVSEGGGIYVFEGMRAGWAELQKSPYSTKHMILFADANDSTQEIGYRSLIDRMQEEGATVSVIGLGQASDSDAVLLEDIAKRGNGRIFFTNNALDIPKLFAQETVAVARSTFVDSATATTDTGQWRALSESSQTWLPTVDGYNLSYAREGSTVSLISADDYQAPLVAHWQRGMGRVASISFPLAGEFSQRAREWSEYGNTMQTLTRWINGDDLPASLTMRHELKGTSLHVDLFYDDNSSEIDWSQIFSQDSPEMVLKEDGSAPRIFAWERLGPGHYSLSQDLTEGALVQGVVKAGKFTFPFGPLKVAGNTEWIWQPERIESLRNLSQSTGGRELVDLSQAWNRPKERGGLSLVPYGVVLLLFLIIIEAWETQAGFQFKGFQGFRRLKKVGSDEVRPIPSTGNLPSKVQPPAEEVKRSAGSRFSKAKRRR